MISEELPLLLNYQDDEANHTLSSSPACLLGNNKSASLYSAKHDAIVLLWQICGPVLLLVGLVGNVLVLVTMTRRRMRGTSTCVYLVGMATIDLVVLIVGLVPGWLEGAEIIVIKDLHPAACKLQKFLDYTSGDAAVWLRMAFTIDRLVAVMVPLYTGSCCGRPSSARTYVIAACVIALVKDAHVFWTRGRQYRDVCSSTSNGVQVVVEVTNCGYPTPEYRHFELYVRPWLAFAVVSVGPFVIIAISNALIIIALVRRRRAVPGHQPTHATTFKGKPPSKNSNEQQFFQMAAMCVAASGLFLVCTAPTIVMLIGKPYWNDPPGRNAAYEISRAVTGVLFYVTFSANFFLYCLTGKRFRVTLTAMCRDSYTSVRSSLTLVDRTTRHVDPLDAAPAGDRTSRPLSTTATVRNSRFRSTVKQPASTVAASMSGTELTQLDNGAASNNPMGDVVGRVTDETSLFVVDGQPGPAEDLSAATGSNLMLNSEDL